MSNPGNIGKYQSDPEVMALINKARRKVTPRGSPPPSVVGVEFEDLLSFFFSEPRC